MIGNNLRLAWRNIVRNKTYSIINIGGLAAGLSSFIVTLLCLNYELSYDKWDTALKLTYRISIQNHADISVQTPAPLGDLLKQKYPNVEAATAIIPNGDFELLLAAGDRKIYQKNVITVDSNFLRVFPYQLTKGDPATVLNVPNAVVLSENVAQKLFGNINPIGKPIKVYNAIDCIVTGVMREPSGPSHLPAEMLMRNPDGKENHYWANYSFQTYIKLIHPEKESKIEDAINRLYYNERLKRDTQSFEAYQKAGQPVALFVDAVSNIHNFPKYGSSQFTTVSILLVLAGLLLLAGTINFSNLAIAQAISRAKQIGVRKVLGSNRMQLVLHFLTDTCLQCIISLCIAASIITLALPFINQSFNINLRFWRQSDYLSIIFQITLCLVTVIMLSGLYPSLFLSRYNTAKVLKGDYSNGTKGMLLRNGLIVMQFMVSVFFIIGILAVRTQMNHMHNQDKGFSGEQVMRIQATQTTREDGFATMQNTLLAIPGVSSVAKTTRVPGDQQFADTSTLAFKYQSREYRMASVKISKEYFRTLKIALLQGRALTSSYADQHTRTAVINQAAAQTLGLLDPVGQTITFPFCDSIPVQIVGVVKNFNVHGFESQIQPEVYTIGNDACMYQSSGAIVVKLSSHHLQQSVQAIEQAWKKIEPDFPIRYSFLDENFQHLFTSYIRLQKIITFFAFVAILISAMGLFALTAFYTKQRTKEIGIRKVMGATVTQLTALLSKEFIYLVLVAIVAVVPVAWWFTQKWLQTFAYRIQVSWWLFAAGGLMSIVIALLTVSVQSMRAAAANPVKSLRNE